MKRFANYLLIVFAITRWVYFHKFYVPSILSLELTNFQHRTSLMVRNTSVFIDQ